MTRKIYAVCKRLEGKAAILALFRDRGDAERYRNAVLGGRRERAGKTRLRVLIRETTLY